MDIGSVTLSSLWASVMSYLPKILLALVLYIVGRWLVKKLAKGLEKGKLLKKFDPSVRTFVISMVRALAMILLVISIVSILGVPMASVIAVLASAGLAVGMALQGALSNMAGGIMLMIFRPFHVGDFVSAGGAEGVVKEITLFYTTIMTLDNRRITVPNGSLMNANVTDFSTEDVRRVDLTFTVGKSAVPSEVQGLMILTMQHNDKILADPAPFARISGGTNEAQEYTVRAWCKTEDYWDVYFDLTQSITEDLAGNGVPAPAVRVIQQ